MSMIIPSVCCVLLALLLPSVSSTSCTQQWSSWSAPYCTDSCGGFGVWTTNRQCISTGSSCGTCIGSINQTNGTICNLNTCAFPRSACIAGYTPGSWSNVSQCVPTCVSQWSTWSSGSSVCSDTCGNCGSMTQTRVCQSNSTCACR
jgi:hypothetical protein